MTAPTAQRVDVERFDLETKPYHYGASMDRSDDGDWVRYEDVAALLQQVAEQAAEIERLRSAFDDEDEKASVHWYGRWVAAERAMEEAVSIFAEVIDTVRDAATDARVNHHAKRGEYHDEMADRIAAFLAANGPKA